MAIRPSTFFYCCLLTLISFLRFSAASPNSDAHRDDEYPAYSYGFDTEALQKRQNTPIIPVTGAIGGAGIGNAPPQRLEIRRLEQNTDLWTLYILGLDMMQYTKQDSPTSWYQIAGKFTTALLRGSGVI